MEIKAEVERRLRARVRDAGRSVSPEEGPDLVRVITDEVMGQHRQRAIDRGERAWSPADERRLQRDVAASVAGWGGFDALLANPRVQNIRAYGCDEVWVQYDTGQWEKRMVNGRAFAVAESDGALIDLVRRLARGGPRETRFDLGNPIVSIPLTDGSRLSAMMAVSQRPIVSLRRHSRDMRHVTLRNLLRRGVVDDVLVAFLRAAVRCRLNILVAGEMGVGKTTFLRALAGEIVPREQHVITIEDTYELYLDGILPNVTPLQARTSNTEGAGEVTIRRLVRESLRHHAQRVLVGEIRGAEAEAMLRAMAQGGSGSMGTIHADSSAQAIQQLYTYAIEDGDIDKNAVRERIAANVHLVVYLAFTDDTHAHRVVSSVRELDRWDGERISSSEIFASRGRDPRARPTVPMKAHTMTRLAAAGFDPHLMGQPGWAGT